MKFRLLCLLASLFFGAFLQAAGLRIASYNLKNYNLCDRRVILPSGQSVYRTEYPKPETEKTALRRAVCAVKPDILAVQEIGGLPYLQELQHDLKKDGQDYPYLFVCTAADTSRQVGFLSKIPFLSTACHTDLFARFLEREEPVKRGLAEVRVSFGGETWALFALHLKSRLTEFKDDPSAHRQRTAEAEALRVRLGKRLQGASHYVVMGDFNDDKSSPSFRRFISERKDALALKPLPLCDSRGEVWTLAVSFKDAYERFDFMLASPAALRQFSAGGVYDGGGALEASDHRLIWADFAAPQEK